MQLYGAFAVLGWPVLQVDRGHASLLFRCGAMFQS